MLAHARTRCCHIGVKVTFVPSCTFWWRWGSSCRAVLDGLHRARTHSCLNACTLSAYTYLSFRMPRTRAVVTANGASARFKARDRAAASTSISWCCWPVANRSATMVSSISTLSTSWLEVANLISRRPKGAGRVPLYPRSALCSRATPWVLV